MATGRGVKGLCPVGRRPVPADVRQGAVARDGADEDGAVQVRAVQVAVVELGQGEVRAVEVGVP